jgi:hypothetical protein
MLPAGPLSTTAFGEILSSRQPFSASPSDSTRELMPVTAKIAIRKSGPITTPVSLTSRNGESASLAEDAVSERRCVGLNSGSASFRVSGAAGSMPAGGKRPPGEGRWLLTEPNSIRISPAQTTHPTRTKAGKLIICFNTTGVCQSKDFIDAADEVELPKEEHSLVLRASEILASLSASVNLTLAIALERLRVISAAKARVRGRSNPTDPCRDSVSHSGLAIAKVTNQMLGAWQCTCPC